MSREQARALLVTDPAFAVLAKQIGMAPETLLEAVLSGRPPRFIVASDYSIADAQAAVGSVVEAVTLSVRGRRARDGDRVERAHGEVSLAPMIGGPRRAVATRKNEWVSQVVGARTPRITRP